MSGTNGNGRAPQESGRAKFEPTEIQRKQVICAIAMGWPIKKVAGVILHQVDLMPISQNTLYKYFAHEIEHGREIMHNDVATNMYTTSQQKKDGLTTQQALGAMMFIAKTQMGWKETTVSEHHVRGGAVFVPEGADDEEWARETAVRNAAASPPPSNGD